MSGKEYYFITWEDKWAIQGKLSDYRYLLRCTALVGGLGALCLAVGSVLLDYYVWSHLLIICGSSLCISVGVFAWIVWSLDKKFHKISSNPFQGGVWVSLPYVQNKVNFHATVEEVKHLKIV
jgi:hypothetical protein